MKNKAFIDTNVLIYSIDKFDKAKQEKARRLLKEVASENAGIISTQVVQEFYVTAVKKLNANPQIVKEIIRDFEKFEIVLVSVEMIKDAIDTSVLYKISFWDALIITCAKAANCQIVYTEDLNDEQQIKDIRIINPF